jgi:uncharacterized membrane protein YdbT with pleckstrin-like domain
MDETGVMLSMPGSVKVLVGKHDMRDYRGARVKRTTVTAIECISSDGRYLNPMINVNLRRFLIQWVVPAFGVPVVLALQCFSRYTLRWLLPAIIVPTIVPAIVMPLLTYVSWVVLPLVAVHAAVLPRCHHLSCSQRL